MGDGGGGGGMQADGNCLHFVQCGRLSSWFICSEEFRSTALDRAQI
jgi:hypothetical protein